VLGAHAASIPAAALLISAWRLKREILIAAS
jgi:hypothetical protein